MNVVDRIDLNRTRIQGREPAAHMFVKMSVLYICLQRVCEFCGRALLIGCVTSRMCFSVECVDIHMVCRVVVSVAAIVSTSIVSCTAATFSDNLRNVAGMRQAHLFIKCGLWPHMTSFGR